MKKVLSLILVAVMAISFSACSSTKKENNDVESTIDKSITALKKCDTKTLKKTVKSETLDSVLGSIETYSGAKTLVKAIFEPLKYTVNDVSIKDGKATVAIEFVTKDLKTVSTKYMQEMVSEYLKGNVNFEDQAFLDAQIEKITSMIQDKSVEEKTFNVTVILEKQDGNWVIILDESVENAIMGGAASTIKSMTSLMKK